VHFSLPRGGAAECAPTCTPLGSGFPSATSRCCLLSNLDALTYASRRGVCATFCEVAPWASAGFKFPRFMNSHSTAHRGQHKRTKLSRRLFLSVSIHDTRSRYPSIGLLFLTKFISMHVATDLFRAFINFSFFSPSFLGGLDYQAPRGSARFNAKPLDYYGSWTGRPTMLESGQFCDALSPSG